MIDSADLTNPYCRGDMMLAKRSHIPRSWQLLMVGPGSRHVTPDLHDRLMRLFDLLPQTRFIEIVTDAGECQHIARLAEQPHGRGFWDRGGHCCHARHYQHHPVSGRFMIAWFRQLRRASWNLARIAWANFVWAAQKLVFAPFRFARHLIGVLVLMVAVAVVLILGTDALIWGHRPVRWGGDGSGINRSTWRSLVYNERAAAMAFMSA